LDELTRERYPHGVPYDEQCVKPAQRLAKVVGVLRRQTSPQVSHPLVNLKKMVRT
jgi:hypothetical protein